MYKNRYYGKVKELSTEQLMSVLQDKKLDYLKIILLFGSRATGKIHPKSDYDFGVVTHDGIVNPWGVLSQVWNDIGDLLNLPECDYDIVDLKNIDKNIINSIQEKYILLKGDNDELQRLFEQYHQASR